MKWIHKLKSLSTFCSIAVLFSLFSLTVLAGPAYSQNNFGVVLVHLIFEDEKWSVGPDGINGALVLPCEAPTKFIKGADGNPIIRVLDANQNVLYRRQMIDPRMIIIEEPSKGTELLSQIAFKARFQLVNGMEQFEFWYNPQEQSVPSVQVDLTDAIKTYIENGGPEQKADCQQPSVTWNTVKLSSLPMLPGS